MDVVANQKHYASCLGLGGLLADVSSLVKCLHLLGFMSLCPGTSGFIFKAFFVDMAHSRIDIVLSWFMSFKKKSMISM